MPAIDTTRLLGLYRMRLGIDIIARMKQVAILLLLLCLETIKVFACGGVRTQNALNALWTYHNINIAFTVISFIFYLLYLILL